MTEERTDGPKVSQARRSVPTVLLLSPARSRVWRTPSLSAMLGFTVKLGLRPLVLYKVQVGFTVKLGLRPLVLYKVQVGVVPKLQFNFKLITFT